MLPSRRRRRRAAPPSQSRSTLLSEEESLIGKSREPVYDWRTEINQVMK
jgi:hypothetical protein